MLRVFFKSDKSSNTTMNFLDIECQSWSTTNSLLVLVKQNGTIQYLPLVNIESFMEM